MVRTRALLAALAPLLVHALARETDRALGLLLKAEVEPAALIPEIGRALAAGGTAVALHVLAWLAAGLGVWLALALWHSRREAVPLSSALEREAAAFGPLWLRPAITLLALASLAFRPSYPYGFTLPVALTQDWSVGQDAAALGAIMALLLPAIRWPAPKAGGVFLVAFLAYVALAPAWAFVWQGHPGNEPKYLRQAVALGQFGTFDAAGVSAEMEDLPTRPLVETAVATARMFVGESRAMVAAVVRGEAGRGAIRASRITRQTVRGKDGGVYYVLAPGPSLMLAPTLRADRTVNLARGARGRVAVSTLVWCALGALLVVASFGLVRDATGRAGLATAVAFAFGLLPPSLFYFYQYYPEMIGALVLAVAFRVLALRPGGLLRHPWLFGWLLAGLPWLHQKFLPVWIALTATALFVAWRTTGPAQSLTPGEPASPVGGVSPCAGVPFAARSRRVGLAAGLLVPQAVSLYLTALYNFAITGSVRPDALFLAWGPAGVTSARVGQGVLGLLLDARYGILPYVPLLLLAGAGLLHGGARRFALVLPAAAVYYFTVASADNWAGAVCNLGRYFMPVAPLAAALAAIAFQRETDDGKPASARRGVVALVLALAAWSGLLAVALWRDPQAANDSALLLAKSTYADGHQYVPNLFFRHWSDAAPGLWARIAAWALATSLLALGLRRVSSPQRALAALAAAILSLAFVLERWPSTRTGPVHADGLPAPNPAVAGQAATATPADVLVFFEGAVRVREDEAVVGPGVVDLLVRQRMSAGVGAAPSLRAIVGGEGVLRVGGLAPVTLRPTGGVVDLPLVTYHVVDGGDVRRAVFSRQRVVVTGQAVLRFGGDAGQGPAGSPGTRPTSPATTGEPDQEDAEPASSGLR